MTASGKDAKDVYSSFRDSLTHFCKQDSNRGEQHKQWLEGHSYPTLLLVEVLVCFCTKHIATSVHSQKSSTAIPVRLCDLQCLFAMSVNMTPSCIVCESTWIDRHAKSPYAATVRPYKQDLHHNNMQGPRM